MSKLYITILFFVLMATGCEKEVGYLEVADASYSVDQLTILHLDTVTAQNNPELYALYKKRIDNKADWTTSTIEGVLGTDPIHYSIEDVKVIGRGDVEIFKKEISIMGGGRLVFPFKYESPKGLYVVSIRIENEGYSKVVKNAFYFSLE